MLVIPVIWEAEIWSIKVQGQPGKKLERPISTNKPDIVVRPRVHPTREA
jgi:hypothetical protein